MVTNLDAVKIDDPRSAVTLAGPKQNVVTVVLTGGLNTGSNLLYGSANPTIAEGVEGDFYFNTSTGDVFGPKGSAVWPASPLGSFQTSVTSITYAAGPQIRAGSGSPEASVSAPLGSLYLNADGGAGTTLYVKESGGVGNTGWVAK